MFIGIKLSLNNTSLVHGHVKMLEHRGKLTGSGVAKLGCLSVLKDYTCDVKKRSLSKICVDHLCSYSRWSRGLLLVHFMFCFYLSSLLTRSHTKPPWVAA